MAVCSQRGMLHRPVQRQLAGAAMPRFCLNTRGRLQIGRTWDSCARLARRRGTPAVSAQKQTDGATVRAVKRESKVPIRGPTLSQSF